MRTVIFARVSSQTERQSTDSQVFELEQYAISKNYEIVKVFTEKISGLTKNKDREVLQECFSFVKDNNIDLIICAEMTRLSRNIWESFESLKYCIDNKINIYFLKENKFLFDENGNENSQLSLDIAFGCYYGKQELETIKYRLNRGRKCAIDRGVKMGRKTGYRKSKEEKEIQYKEVIKLLRKGMTIKQIYAICKENGNEVSERTIWSLKKEFFPKNTHG